VAPILDGGLEIEMAPGQDARPAVARAVVEADYSLLELRPIGMSLEDIFLELTRDEPLLPEMSDEGLLEDETWEENREEG
jgi:hypothetical protein